jgi:hypothetical protein
VQWRGASGGSDRLVSRRLHDWRGERGNSVDDRDSDAGGNANRRLRSAVLLTLFASDAASVRGGLRHRRRVVRAVHLTRTVVAHTALATSVRTQLPAGTRRPGNQEAEQHDGRREAAARHHTQGYYFPGRTPIMPTTAGFS